MIEDVGDGVGNAVRDAGKALEMQLRMWETAWSAQRTEPERQAVRNAGSFAEHRILTGFEWNLQISCVFLRNRLFDVGRKKSYHEKQKGKGRVYEISALYRYT